MILETERLYLREMTFDDKNDLSEILQDPRVMYTYDHEFSDTDVQIWLERQLARYHKDGFGLWAMILKETDEMIGQAGLTFQQCAEEEVLEIGYLLKKRFMHYGYAKEAAEGCKRYAFDRLNATKVYSIIRADNVSSMKVAKAIGMHKEKEFMTQYYSGKQLHYLFMIQK
ncbi:GNAT family N-acetyltransferase [Beduini massiliensis]|uniref:GNAT family N-acetyltransferase n=1 Tax=Beduini massiliensis TaxID=1585974 RepID=UPI00059A8E73|nr:GNAT family N-acetyltransferase [Beduini massiliensis]